MAKEKKEEKKVPTSLTSENVVEQAKLGNTMSLELKEKMEAQLKESKEKQQIGEISMRYQKVAYRINKGLVDLRRSKKQHEIALYNVRQQGRLSRFLTGFTVTEIILNEYAKTEDDVLKLESLKDGALVIKVLKDDGKSREEKSFKLGDNVPAIIDIVDFDEGVSILAKNLRKRIEEADAEHTKNVKVIEAATGDYWNNDWRYDLRTVNVGV